MMSMREKCIQSAKSAREAKIHRPLSECYPEIVDAVLDALMEPSNAMCDAGEGWNLRCGCPECDHEEWEKVREGFRAMIQAARSGK